MCGSATLAIVVSSTCMIVASITQIVISPRCWTGRCLGASLMASRSARRAQAEQVAQAGG